MQKLWKESVKRFKRVFYLWEDRYYKYSNTLSEIRVGYYNLLLYKLGMFTAEYVKPYEDKLEICEGCPLSGKRFGLEICDNRESYQGIEGCGCVLAAKLWSDSPCPRELF
jgi:hypothetical protein